MSRILILSMLWIQFAWTGPLTEQRSNGWLNGWSGAKSLAGQIAASVQNFKPLDLRLGSLFVPMTSIGSAYYEHIADRKKRIQELRLRRMGLDNEIKALSRSSQKEDTAELLRLINLGIRWEEKEEEEDSFGLGTETLISKPELRLEKPTEKVSVENGPKMWMAPPGQTNGPAFQAESLAANLRLELPDPMIPWAVSDRVFGALISVPGAVYKKAQILPTDKEWRFVWRQFYHDKPIKWGIGRVYCIHERTQTGRFENNLATIEKEAMNPVFSPDWHQEPRANQRVIAMHRWEAATSGFSPFDVMEHDGRRTIRKASKVLPLWHGSNQQKCHSIAESGFTYFGKVTLLRQTNSSTDEGYFGSGIYFTNSARYAADIYSHGHLMMSWVSMREPFPVVGDSNQQDMMILRGQGAYKHYNAHYIPVAPQDLAFDCAKYFPCQPGQLPVCDELVVFQAAQTLPRYWVELQVEHPAMISPSVRPEFVVELVPYIVRALENPHVDRDIKLRNMLNQKLAKLLEMATDDDLELDDRVFFVNLQQLFDSRGFINKSVRDTMTFRDLVSSEAQTQAYRKAQIEAQQKLNVQESTQRSRLNTEEFCLRQQLQQSRTIARHEIAKRLADAIEETRRQQAQREETERFRAHQAQQTAFRIAESVARTTAMMTSINRGNWYIPKGTQSVENLGWELGRKGSKKMTFKDAQSYAESRKKDGWRLPTIWELEALYQQKEVLGDDLRNAGYFWTETPVSGRIGFHWLFNFEYGYVGSYDDHFHQVRLCRSDG